MTIADTLPIVGGFVGLVGGACGIVSAYLNWDRNRIAKEAHSILVGYSVVFRTDDDRPEVDALCLTVFNKSPGQTVAVKDWGLDNGLGPVSVPRDSRGEEITLTIDRKRSKELRYPVSCYVKDGFHFGSRTSLWVQFEHEPERTEVPLSERDQAAVKHFGVWVQSQRSCARS